MTDIILHHYEGSPFAKKIRAILGAKQVNWQSVAIPPIMPKPDVVALTGGYRRTPFMQIGAHIYCDTALIARVIDRLYPAPVPLYDSRQPGTAMALSAWADSALFQHAVSLISNPKILMAMFGGNEAAAKAFAMDRAAMMRNTPRRHVSCEEANVFFDGFLPQLNAQLATDGPYLIGETLSIADFSVFHPLWFIRHKPVTCQKFEGLTALNDWLTCMEDLGEGTSTDLSSSEAIDIANRTDIGTVESKNGLQKIELGDSVAVTPGDYALDPVEGTLCYSDEHEVVLIRTDARAGEVAVHFPRLGYDIRQAE